MKTFSEYKNSNNCRSISESVSTRRNQFPKDKKELEKIIKKEIKKQGNDADLNHIDVSNITDFSELFKKSEFNGDISKWDVSNATNMSSMFEESKFAGDISEWDVSNVTDMHAMFYQAESFNQDLSGWDVSKVTDMSHMFENSKFSHDISRWDVSNVLYMGYMFSNVDPSMPIETLSVWNPVKVEDIRGFYNMEDKSRVSFIKDVWQHKIESPESCIGIGTYLR